MFILEAIAFWIILLVAIRLLKRKLAKPNYNGQIVWITGASSGLGQHLAYQFNQKGAKVILSARNQKQLTRVKNACKFPQKVMILKLDMVQFNQTRSKTEKIIADLQKLGQRINVVVQNAGISLIGTIANTPLQKHLQLINLNLNAVYNHLQPIIKDMMRYRNGHIIGMTSVAGKLSLPYAGSYSASKSAFIGLLDSLRTQVSSFNITVTNIYPGYVKTNILDVLPQHQDAQVRQVIKNQKIAMAKNGLKGQQFATEVVKAVYNRQTQVHVSKNNLIIPFLVLMRAICPDLSFFISRMNMKTNKQKITKQLKKN